MGLSLVLAVDAGAAGVAAVPATSAARAQVITAAAPTPGGSGFWTVSAKGAVMTLNGAPSFGDASGLPLNAPIVGIAPTTDGGGYWLLGSDGGVFGYGDAHFYGSTGNIHLNQPIVGMAATPDGKGYWLVAADGGLFAFGDAQFYGSAAGTAPSGSVVSIVATHDGGGYWIVANTGAIYNYGDATTPPPPACTTAAITAGAITNGSWDPGSNPVLDNYICSSDGNFAAINVDVGTSPERDTITLLLAASGGIWQAVSRGYYCENGLVPMQPSTFYTLACLVN